MEKLLNKPKKRKNLLKLLHYREINADSAKYVKEYCQFTDHLIERLGVDRSLDGHKGCVNCLQWSFDGSVLASGSDDTNIIFWDPFRYKNLRVLKTNHNSNIFSVKFLSKDNTVVATAAADYKVLITSITGETFMNCSCHRNRVKRLETTPEEPHLFWSAGEDGFVIQYDIREHHECNNSNNSTILLKMNSHTKPAYEIKCIAVNPTQPHYMAIGVNDCFIRLFDRRMLKTCSFSQLGETSQYPLMKNLMDKKVLEYYSPGHLAVENSHIFNAQFTTTYISFNAAGSEMLMNLGGEQIYLFNINHPRPISEMRMPSFTKNNNETIEMNDNDPINTFNNNYNYDNSNNCKCQFEQKSRNSFTNNECSNERCINFLMKEAAKFTKRQWLGDVYNAARDYLTVIKTKPDEIHAYTGLINTLITLGWLDDAQIWLDYTCKMNEDAISKKKAKILKQSIQMAKHKTNQNSAGSSSNQSTEDYDLPVSNATSALIDDYEIRKRLNSRDFESRFIGHCNLTTDIKEANFLGQDGNYIVAGSDEGMIFIWERKRSSLITTLFGDSSIVNCVQPHPNTCLLATSGIDTAVKLWSPQPESEAENPWRVKEINSVIESNQVRMTMDPLESMLINMGYQMRGVGLDDAPSCQPC